MTGITADPVFQLNCILWMLQPLPDIASAPTPVLHKRWLQGALHRRTASGLP